MLVDFSGPKIACKITSDSELLMKYVKFPMEGGMLKKVQLRNQKRNGKSFLRREVLMEWKLKRSYIIYERLNVATSKLTLSACGGVAPISFLISRKLNNMYSQLKVVLVQAGANYRW